MAVERVGLDLLFDARRRRAVAAGHLGHPVKIIILGVGDAVRTIGAVRRRLGAGRGRQAGEGRCVHALSLADRPADDVIGDLAGGEHHAVRAKAARGGRPGLRVIERLATAQNIETVGVGGVRTIGDRPDIAVGDLAIGAVGQIGRGELQRTGSVRVRTHHADLPTRGVVARLDKVRRSSQRPIGGDHVAAIIVGITGRRHQDAVARTGGGRQQPDIIGLAAIFVSVARHRLVGGPGARRQGGAGRGLDQPPNRGPVLHRAVRDVTRMERSIGVARLRPNPVENRRRLGDGGQLPSDCVIGVVRLVAQFIACPVRRLAVLPTGEGRPATVAGPRHNGPRDRRHLGVNAGRGAFWDMPLGGDVQIAVYYVPEAVTARQRHLLNLTQAQLALIGSLAVADVLIGGDMLLVGARFANHIAEHMTVRGPRRDHSRVA